MCLTLDCCGYSIRNPDLYQELFARTIYCPSCHSLSYFHEENNEEFFLSEDVSICCGSDIHFSEDSDWDEYICESCGMECDLISKDIYDKLHPFVDPNQLKIEFPI